MYNNKDGKYIPRKKYTNNKRTYRKTNNSKFAKTQRGYIARKGKNVKTFQKATPTSIVKFSPDRSYFYGDQLSGFDKSIYKTNKIINEIGHGFEILGKPVEGLIKLAKDINPLNFFKKK